MLRLKSWNQQSSSFVLYSAYSDHFYPLQSPDTAQTLGLIPGVCKGYNGTFFISKLVFNIIASSSLFSHNLNRSQQGGGQYSSTPPPSSYNQGGYRPSHSGGHQSFQRKTHTNTHWCNARPYFCPTQCLTEHKKRIHNEFYRNKGWRISNPTSKHPFNFVSQFLSKPHKFENRSPNLKPPESSLKPPRMATILKKKYPQYEDGTFLVHK